MTRRSRILFKRNFVSQLKGDLRVEIGNLRLHFVFTTLEACRTLFILRERFQCLLPYKATRCNVAPLVARVGSRLALFLRPIMFERNSVSL